jgi:hypothetical protein
MKAWLITWVAIGHNTAIPVSFVDAVSLRKSAKYVAEHVQRLYNASHLNLRERLAAERYNQPLIPHKAKIFTVLDKVTGCHKHHISCGYDPMLFARLVTGLHVEFDPQTGTETLVWDEAKD